MNAVDSVVEAGSDRLGAPPLVPAPVAAVTATPRTPPLGAKLPLKVVEVALCLPIQNLNGQDRFV